MNVGSMDLCDLIRQLRAEFFAKDGDVTLQAGKTVYVSGGGEISVPVGGIILWSGSVASIPTGWALCDGNNGTPDLTDRFVVGAGDTYDPGDTGGATTDTSSSDSHSHSDGSLATSASSSTWEIGTFVSGTYASRSSHTHTISGTTGSDSHSHSVDILPPYYALAYIMRTS